MVYKRAKADGTLYPFWWYRFKRNGIAFRVCTKQGNKQTAEQLEAAHRTRLAKGEAGIRDYRTVPTLRQFQERFIDFVKTRSAKKPKTITFYENRYGQLLNHTPLADSRLDQIDEAGIERYVQHRGDAISRSTINRDLAALRRVLRMAQEWKVIDRIPRVRLLSGENIREYVLDKATEPKYLAACPQPLRDIATLILETGLRLGEALHLEWDDVHLEPASGKKFGYLQIREGKTKNARRAVSLTPRATKVLSDRRAQAVNHLVFPGGSIDKPFVTSSMSHVHADVRVKLTLPEEFVLHSLRHTALTRLGAAGVDVFTIMKIAGHSNIAISQRYVHPSSEAMEGAFEKLAGAQSGHMTKKSKRKNPPKLLIPIDLGA